MTIGTKNIKARDGRGRATRSKETAEQDAKAAELRSRSMSYRHIAAALHISVSTAHESVERGMAMVPLEGAAEAKRMELAKLDRIEAHLLAVMERAHVKVDHGRVILLDDGPMIDDAPGVQAAIALIRVQERRSKLLGLDSPVRVDQQVTIHDGDSRLDNEIERLMAQMGRVGEKPAEVEASEPAEPAHT